MGHRAALSVRKFESGDFIELFEANNSLPSFWLFLLDQASVDLRAPAMREWETLDGEALDRFYEVEPPRTGIPLEARAALALAMRRREYIVSNYPARLELFDEWIAYLRESSSGTDASFWLDIVDIAGFSTVDDFLRNLGGQLAALDGGPEPAVPLRFDEAIGELTGWISFGIAAAYRERSPAYRDLEARHELERRTSNSPRGPGGGGILAKLSRIFGFARKSATR